MTIQQYIPGRATVSMTVWGTNGYTDDEILDFAIAHAGETRVRLFGWSVVRKGMFASVSLHKD